MEPNPGGHPGTHSTPLGPYRWPGLRSQAETSPRHCVHVAVSPRNCTDKCKPLSHQLPPTTNLRNDPNSLLLSRALLILSDCLARLRSYPRLFSPRPPIPSAMQECKGHPLPKPWAELYISDVHLLLHALIAVAHKSRESYGGNQVLAVFRHFPECPPKGQHVSGTDISPVNFESSIKNESRAYYQE